MADIRCCCLTSWIRHGIIGSFISNARLPCKICCSGPLLCMPPTLDIYNRLVSKRLSASRPNLPILFFNRLLALVLESLYRDLTKMFIWLISCTSVMSGVCGRLGVVGHGVAVEMRENMSGHLVDAMTFSQNIWQKWMENMPQTVGVPHGLKLCFIFQLFWTKRLINCSEIFTWQDVVLTSTWHHPSLGLEPIKLISLVLCLKNIT